MKVAVKRHFQGRNVEITTEFIKLQDFMKLGDMVPSGGTAKLVIQDGAVTVNGETQLQRGKKLVPGDVVSFQGTVCRVVAHEA